MQSVELMVGSHRAAVAILDMSLHFFAYRQKCRDLICFIKIDTSYIYCGQFLAPYDTLRHLTTPLSTVMYRTVSLSKPYTQNFTWAQSIVTAARCEPGISTVQEFDDSVVICTNIRTFLTLSRLSNSNGLFHPLFWIELVQSVGVKARQRYCLNVII